MNKVMESLRAENTEHLRLHRATVENELKQGAPTFFPFFPLSLFYFPLFPVPFSFVSFVSFFPFLFFLADFFFLIYFCV